MTVPRMRGKVHPTISATEQTTWHPRVAKGTLLDHDGLVSFAIDATVGIRNECSSLAKLSKPNPFFAILSSHLFDANQRLDRSPKPDERRIIKLLGILERLTRWPEQFQSPTQPTDRSSYPGLLKMLGDSTQNTKTSLNRLAGHPKAYNDRMKYQRDLKAFANTKAAPRGPEISELTRSVDQSKADVTRDTAEGFQALYSALNRLCCGTGFKANLFVSHDPRSTSRGESIKVASFFRHTQPVCHSVDAMWKETQVEVLSEQHTSSDPKRGKTRVVRFSPKGDLVADFCKLICSPELGCLQLQLSDGDLFDQGLEFRPQKTLISLQRSSLSLAKVLGSSGLNDPQRKLLLSYLVAKAVWHFFDSDWINESWSKHEVQFMWQRTEKTTPSDALNHRPFISAHFSGTEDRIHSMHSETARRTHVLPKVLALGIVLLEIELGEHLETRYASEYFNAQGKPTANASHMSAGELINSDAWASRKSMYKAVKQAIEICVKPDLDRLGTDPKKVRENLHRHVVAPLGILFGIAWDCDGSPELFEPGPLTVDGLNIQDDETMSRTVSNVNGAGDSLAASSAALNDQQVPAYHSGAMNLELNAEFAGGESYELFGNESQEEHDPKACKQTDKWIYTFKTLRLKHKIGVGASTRIRLAIIDTGIDTNHPTFRRENRRVKECESFTEGDAASDLSGHGTHVAGIVLDLTNNVDLYVAKFTNTRICDDHRKEDTRDRVIKALQRARLDWKVHMISLSFGFSKPGREDAVRKEIEKCLNSNIAVFASASNDGGNRPRTYPGNYDRVLCIHSATGTGDGSSYSPTPEEDSKVYNFSAVGDGIKSCWPTDDGNGDSPYRYMSGTSFATPVAVSIAAFMVGYIDKHLPDYGWNIDPLSPEGVRKLFELMSRDNKRHGYDWLSPQWLFTKYSEAKIQQDLIHKLGGYSKT